VTEREALEGMVTQYAYWSDSAGGYTTGGLSALEDAFAVCVVRMADATRRNRTEWRLSPDVR
jgi:hypothetical protein